MRASLPEEIRAFLAAQGPHRSTDIARAVKARRIDVQRTLNDGAFEHAEKPEGAEPRSVYWKASDVVPRRRSRSSRRADLLLSLLMDGRPLRRQEIWAAAGEVFATNNAAHELRRRGYVVEYVRSSDSYRLVSLAEPEVAPTVPQPSPPSGSASETRSAA